MSPMGAMGGVDEEEDETRRAKTGTLRGEEDEGGNGRDD